MIMPWLFVTALAPDPLRLPAPPVPDAERRIPGRALPSIS
jgi:hypothetical protein